MLHYSRFTRLFPVQKTLRMGLEPVGETLHNISIQGAMEADSCMADHFSRAKELVDDWHKWFMQETLRQLRLPAEEVTACCTPDDKLREKAFSALRGRIAGAFTSQEVFPLLWKKELIASIVPAWLQRAEDRAVMAAFAGHTGYFTEYNMVRRLLYEAKPLKGSVAYRLVDENLPVFLKNRQVMQKLLSSAAAGCVSQVYRDFEEYLGVCSLAEMFVPEYYDRLLTQTGIDVYNLVLCGRTLEDGTKVKGLNEYINLHNQKAGADGRVPLFGKLKKMILSDRSSISWLPAKFEDDNELLTAVAEAYDALTDAAEGGILQLGGIFSRLYPDSLSGVYVSSKSLNVISGRLTGRWNTFCDALVDAQRCQVRVTRRMTEEKIYEKAKALFEKKKVWSLGEIADALDAYENTGDAAQRLAGRLAGIFGGGENDFAVQAAVYRKLAGRWLDYRYPDSRQLIADERAVTAVKNLLDCLMDIKHVLDWFMGGVAEEGRDTLFYGQLTEVFEKFIPFGPLYNMVRNYLTRKPYSTEKMKLNFGYSGLMAGWDADKMGESGAFLARRGADMFLAVLRKGAKVKLPQGGWVAGDYERVVYKQVSGAFRTLPKIFFSEKWLTGGKVELSADLKEGYDRKRHLKGDGFDLAFCHRLIDYFKECIRHYEGWQVYGFRFSDTESYEDISQFYKEVENQAYYINYAPLDAAGMDALVRAGDIYLFRIYNRDLSPYAKGRKSLQTLYYQMLFDPRNLADVVYKLNGGAAMYFRKASLNPSRPTHPAGVPIANKNPLNPKKTSVFEYDIIKDRRYTVDKFEFHFSITVNCNCRQTALVNRVADEFIRSTPDLHVIGINRGENNLVYVSVIDLDGRIVEQRSLNLISSGADGRGCVTDWQQKLAERAGERTEARRSWMSVKQITDLKQGFISQAVHEVVKLLYKYKAVIAIEDLDDKFKQSRRMFEKEVYSRFEDALVSKLNFLVDKARRAEEVGGLLHGLQLTALADEAGDYKQNGIVFKVPTWYYSMTCPATGFINFFKVKYKNVKLAQEFFSGFRSIRYVPQSGRFEFDFDYTAFTEKCKGGRTEWTVCTHGKRYDRQLKKEVDITAEMRQLLSSHGVEFSSGADIREDVLRQNGKAFFEPLMRLFELTLQMRNFRVDGGDYLVSPVADDSGHVFSSDDGQEGMPVCGDANDAYNIARRGLMFVHDIRQSEDSFVKLRMSLADWVAFVQK